jgi:HEAT repeat protein
MSVPAIAAVLAMAPTARADYTEEQLKADRKLLDDAKVPHTDSDLLTFFRRRLVNEETRLRIEELIKKLGSKNFKDRAQASADIVSEGPPALPVLRKVMEGNAELEMRRRAEECIKEIEKKSPNTLVLAAARVLKHRRVEGAAAVLLEYVAVAPDATVEEEIDACIFALAMVGARVDVLPPVAKAGTLDPILINALTDKESSRRAIAALAVGRYGSREQRKQVANLLGDKEAAVRFRAAQGLVYGRDLAGVPVLIDMLDKGPMPLAIQAEDLLSVIADEKGPAAPLAEKLELRKKCHDAWQEWYQQNKGKIDLAKLDVDSTFGGLEARASKGAIQFMEAFLKFDTVLLAKLSDVPFTFAGAINFNSREEFDNFVNMFKSKGGGRPPELKFKVRNVVPGSEYVKNAPETERNFLEMARVAQIQIVYVDINEGRDVAPFFMRISGGRARCIGFGQSRSEK